MLILMPFSLYFVRRRRRAVASAVVLSPTQGFSSVLCVILAAIVLRIGLIGITSRFPPAAGAHAAPLSKNRSTSFFTMRPPGTDGGII